MTTTPNLSELVDQYAEAVEAKNAAEDRVKDLRAELLTAYSEAGHPDALEGRTSRVTVSTSSGWRLDTTRLKKEQAEVYAAYALPTSSTRLNVFPR